MGIKYNGEIVSPKVFAKKFVYDNMKSLHEHTEMIFEKFPEKYGGMTGREIGLIKDGIERVLETVNRALALEHVEAKAKAKAKLKG